MSIIGTNTAQSVAGLGQAERIVTRDNAKKDADKASVRRAVKDELDLVVSNTQSADAVRSLKGNKEEETREDKQEHPGYTKQPPGQGAAGIDVEA